jgi:glycosyltransferase involved in cell wall biosynthesis
MKTANRVCFYPGVRESKILSVSGWYGLDSQILRDLGFDVRVSQSLYDVPLNSDLYFAWWPTTGALPMVAASMVRKPFLLVAGGSSLVNDFNGLEKVFGFYRHGRAARRLITATVRAAACTFAISEHVADQAARLGARRIEVVPLGVATTKYRPAVSKDASPRRNLLCIVSHLSHSFLFRKPVWPLIQAMPAVLAQHSDARLTIVGNREDAVPGLQQLAEHLGVGHAITFAGRVTEAEKIALLQQAIAYVQPTLHENFGVALAEAMSCGTPVISSPVAAVPEVIGDCGFYAAAGDPASWSAAMNALLENPADAKTLGARGRARVQERFSQEARRDRFQDVLGSMDLVNRGASFHA